MNKNVLLVIAAVIVIGLGLFMFLGEDNDNNSSSNNQNTTGEPEIVDEVVEGESEADEGVPEGDVTISYTDDGFESDNQVVRVGSKVTFVNNSSKSMWIASAEHPTHTELPEFDAKEGVGSGESYEFTFTEIGQWDFHNHLSSSDEGTITVVPAN